GARREGNTGRFEDADGGTLFLDEVSELPLAAQTALLRVLQEGEIVRLGCSMPRRVDVRVIAATNRALEEEIRAGRFRSDLYYRLNVLAVLVPPLRSRGEDVLLLAQAFLADTEAGRRGSTFSAQAIAALQAHSWPGNVRELKNVILRAATISSGSTIGPEDLGLGAPASGPPSGEGHPSSGEGLRDKVSSLERSAVLEALESCRWNYAQAARQLGISRMTLYRWARKYGISRVHPVR
ncbi:MAG: sigma-54-dependent Fis family transcriptional regulator, partial [Deltaproteobacteria bacterium]|nr:sigma-54-dependent Fis family transcriptional regulator [Deltaproteobacteria bacterium]